jgi:hypothetical protein
MATKMACARPFSRPKPVIFPAFHRKPLIQLGISDLA